MCAENYWPIRHTCCYCVCAKYITRPRYDRDVNAYQPRIMTVLHAIVLLSLSPPHSNDLTDLPEELAELRYIRTLRLKYNQLKRIPAVVVKLPQLMILEVSGNKIQKVDDSIGQLAILKELDLSGNEIVSVSEALGTLPKLEVRH